MQYTAGDLKPCHTPWTVILGTFTQKQYKDIPKFKSLKNSLTAPLKRHKKKKPFRASFFCLSVAFSQQPEEHHDKTYQIDHKSPPYLLRKLYI